MSGIEVAGLVFGVLPLLIETVKAYSTLADGLHRLRHYSKEVKSIALQLNTQHVIFLNHCRLLLRIVENERVVEEMLEDQTDQRWTSKTLNDKMNEVLRASFQLCRDIIDGTKDVVDDMREEMGGFDVLTDGKKPVSGSKQSPHLSTHQRQGESISTAIKRLRKAVKVTFNKSKYEKCLASLRDRNDDLSVLRSQIGAFQQTSNTTGALVRHQALPERFQSIQSASQKLHEALCNAWCCDDPAHGGHYAKLCLDAEVHTEVRLDLAISCHETAAARDQRQVVPRVKYRLQCTNSKQPATNPSNLVVCAVHEYHGNTARHNGVTIHIGSAIVSSARAFDFFAQSTEEEGIV
jgi:hypothetical protein